jgi:hypothetical protein
MSGSDVCIPEIKLRGLLIFKIEIILKRSHRLEISAQKPAVERGGRTQERLSRNCLRCLRIDSKESFLPAYVAWRPGATNTVGL